MYFIGIKIIQANSDDVEMKTNDTASDLYIKLDKDGNIIKQAYYENSGISKYTTDELANFVDADYAMLNLDESKYSTIIQHDIKELYVHNRINIDVDENNIIKDIYYDNTIKKRDLLNIYDSKENL